MRLDPITLIAPTRAKTVMPSTQSNTPLIPDSMNSPCSHTPTAWLQVMPDDHSKSVPLRPIPNRTVKRLRADDSADPRVKVGHRQAITAHTALPLA